VLIYSPFLTPRLRYLAGFLSGYFGTSVELTEHVEDFLHGEEVKINYSGSPIVPGEFRIAPAGLLFEKGLQPLIPVCFPFAGTKAFFGSQGDFPFDVFSAVFYLISRYEEYLPHEKDEYGRYDYRNSLAFREGFLHQPAVDIWLKAFSEALHRHFPGAWNPRPRSFRLLPTYDIDIAWSYRHKGFIRNAGGLARSLFKGEWKMAGQRLKVLAGKEPDPYDSYEWMDRHHRQYALEPIYFFHLGQSRNRYDKSIGPRHPALQQLVASTARKYETGIHPSWHSGDHPEKLVEEKNSLQTLTGNAVTRSRQHFIRFTLPQTFRLLADAGIEHEYSMGYGSINGFRASITSPYYWYDLEKEEQTPLMIHPFCFMDANSFYEQKLSPTEAFAEAMRYYEAVKSAGGQMVTIWHNSFLGTDPLFAGWKEVYERFISSVCSGRSSA
jgi:hypothetical protein